MEKRPRPKRLPNSKDAISPRPETVLAQLNLDIEGLEKLQVMQLRLIREIRKQLEHVARLE